MQIRSLLGPFVVALASLPLANAQLSPDTATGLSPYAVYKGGDIDNVNPASGNVFLDIPLVSFPQRGKDLRLAFHIYSNDKQWYIDTGAINCAGVSSAFFCGAWAGPVFTKGEVTAPNSGVYIGRDQNVTFGLNTSVTSHDYCPGSAPCVQTTTVSGIYALTPDGAKHYIADQQTQTPCGGNCPTAVNFQSSYPANDASRYTPTGFPIPGRNAEVVDGDGIHYNGTQVTDSNGNFITASASGWTDTLDRLIPGVLPSSTAGPGSSPDAQEPIPGIASSAALGHCPTGTISAREWDVPAALQYNNGSATYYICYRNFNYQTAFDLDTVFSDPAAPTTYYQDVVETGASGTNNMPALLLSAIVLPDLTQYTFSYEEQYLSLAQVTLPTGGSISYQWQPIPFDISSAAPVSEALRKRTINPGHGQPPQTWTYYWNITFDPPAGPGGPRHTHYPIWSVVTDPEGNDEERQIGGTDDSGNPVEKGVVAKVMSYQGCGPHDNNTNQPTCSPGNGTLLRTESYSLANVGSGGADVQTPSAPTVNLQQPSVITTSYPTSGNGSFVKKQAITRVAKYGSCTLNDGSGGSSVITPCYSSNQTQMIAYYDFGQGTPGPVLRTDSFTYKWQDSAAPAYFDAHFLNLIKSETHVGGGSNMETDYSYDEPSYFTPLTAGTQQNGPPASVRGNATTISRVSNNGPNQVTHTNWYGTGVPSSTQDANQATTTYLYSTSGPNYGAYPTTITNALSQPTQYTYDANLGKPLTVIDANGQTTTYSYADPFGRLRDVLYPNVYPGTGTKGETTYHYNDSSTAPSVMVTMKVNPAVTEQIEEDVDGVGRVITTKTTDGSAVNQVDTNYDANGHVASVSNPHRPGAPFSSDGTTGYTYDALGRMLTQTQPDGGVQRWTYSGATVDFFDETNRHWQRLSDGLGRLITVFEPDPSDNATIGTLYQYDGNGNLLHVDQTGGGSGFGGDRVRTFSYDSLSRLVAAQNPENLSATNQANLTCPGATGGPWTTCYGYDPNGNLTSKVDNRNVTTTYGYDALNRLKSKTYTNDLNNTPSVTMVYDAIANGVNTVGRLVQEYTGPSAAPLTQRTITQYDPMGRVQQENQCLMGSCATGGHTLQYSYDLAGNLYTETNGVASPAIALTYGYDAVNRLSSVTNNYTQDAQHPTTLFSATSYGPVGLLNASLGINSLSSVTAVTRALTYDSRQRILTDTENGHPNLPPTATISGSEQSYFVCTSGNCRSHTDGGTLTVTVNGFAAIATYAAGSTSATVAQSLTNALNGSGSPVHAALSGLTITMSGASSYTMSTSGTVTEGGCNQSCHTTPDFVATLAGGVANGPLYSYALNSGYALNGNVIGFTDSVQGQWGFGYDNVNRMTSGTPTAGPYNGLTFVWAYDPFGNRRSQTVSGSSQTTIQSTPPLSFIASASNHADGGSYDAMGNMTHDQLNSYAYDAEGRLCAVAPQAGGATGYLYDAEGQRWAKGSLNGLSCNFSSNGFAATSTYLLGPAGEQFTELNGSGGWIHTNVFAAGSLLATYDSVGTHFALADWLGTKRIQASATGGIDETCMSLPFGDSLTCMGPDATEHHFTGKEHDIESGLDNFGARYYGSTMGRFMTPDPSGVASASLSDPQSFNLYSYARNNPLKFTDPTGLVCHWDDGTHDDSPADGGASYEDCATQGGSWSEDTTVNVTADNNGNQLDVTQSDSWGPFISFIPGKRCASALSTAGANSQAMVRYYQNYQGTITNAANSNGIPPNFLAAVGIRESGLQNIAQSGGQGRGVFQIDLGANPNVSAAQAFDVNFSATFAANMLSSNEATLAAQHPNLDPTHLMQATAASYNFGTKNVSGNPNTIDAGTTAGNYGSNVMAISGNCFGGG